MEQQTGKSFPFAVTFLALITFVCGASGAIPVDDHLIKQICSETQNNTFCLDYINKLDCSTKTLPDLAKKTISWSGMYWTVGNDRIRIDRTSARLRNDTAAYRAYDNCVRQYADVGVAVAQLGKLLNAANYQDMPYAAAFAIKRIDDCDANFKQPLTEDPGAKIHNEANRDIYSTILAISNHLAAAGRV